MNLNDGRSDELEFSRLILAGEFTGFGDPKGHGPMDYCLTAVIDHVFM